MADITQSDLNKLIEQHEKWLNNNEIGKRPNFSGMDLSYLELKRANLYHSIFEGSNLTGCNFRYTNLDKADLKKANLTKANLKETNLFRANLHQAILKDVKVNEYTKFYFQLCPEEGSFIGYKKVDTLIKGEYAIVKMLIPEDAKRNSATTYRCRADKVVVLEIQDSDGNQLKKAYSNRNHSFVYEVGGLLEVKEFDDDRWHETASGIHFYLSKEIAKYY